MDIGADEEQSTAAPCRDPFSSSWAVQAGPAADPFPIKGMSKVFRLPLAYVLYVSSIYFHYTFVPQPPVFLGDANSTGLGYYSSGMTAQGQISSALSSIIMLMLSYLSAAMYDRTNGGAIYFPLFLASAMKDAATLILKAWQQHVVLSSIFHKAACWSASSTPRRGRGISCCIAVLLHPVAVRTA